MAATAILNFKNVNFWLRDCHRVQYLLLRTRFRQNPPSWICCDVTILHCRTHFRCPNIVLKFNVDRVVVSEILAVS